MAEREIRRCDVHGERPAVATCVTCGKALCAACARVVEGRYYCAADAPTASASAPRAMPRFRPGYLVVAAAMVALAWGILLALKPLVAASTGTLREGMSASYVQAAADAADAFKKDMGRYPTQEEGLRALVQEPAAGKERWLGPYLADTYVKDGVVADAAGRPVIYKVEGARHVLYGVGADGAAGTKDDLKVVLEDRRADIVAGKMPQWRGLFGAPAKKR